MRFDASSCFVKTRRAREHLQQMNAIGKELSGTDTYWRTETERNGRDVVVRLRLGAPLPPDTACVVGDVVHNARSALDYLACLAVEANGGTVTRRTQFPVCTEPSAFSRNIKQQLAGAPAFFIDLAESVQPYKRVVPAESPLHIVNRLDIADKHRQLLAAAVIPASIEFSIDDAPQSVEHVELTKEFPFPLVDGTPLVRFRLALGYEVIRPAFRLGLGSNIALVEQPPVHGQPLIHMLLNLISELESTVIFPAEQLPW